MMSFWKNIVLFGVFTFVLSAARTEARPQGILESSQNMDPIDTEIDDLRSVYYDVPMQQSIYPNLPLDRLKMLVGYVGAVPTNYMRSSASNTGLSESFRGPESKRQVRYRQCYFNPISCFRK